MRRANGFGGRIIFWSRAGKDIADNERQSSGRVRGREHDFDCGDRNCDVDGACAAVYLVAMRGDIFCADNRAADDGRDDRRIPLRTARGYGQSVREIYDAAHDNFGGSGSDIASAPANFYRQNIFPLRGFGECGSVVGDNKICPLLDRENRRSYGRYLRRNHDACRDVRAYNIPADWKLFAITT